MINGTLYKHVKTQRFYILLSCSVMSQNADPKHDYIKYCIYQSIKDNSVWVCPFEEFFDGRFVLVLL